MHFEFEKNTICWVVIVFVLVLYDTYFTFFDGLSAMLPFTAYKPRIPCSCMATEVSIRQQNKREVGIQRLPAYAPDTPLSVLCILQVDLVAGLIWPHSRVGEKLLGKLIKLLPVSA